jgi:hypothetical protein
LNAARPGEAEFEFAFEALVLFGGEIAVARRVARAPEGRALLSRRALFQRLAALCVSMAVAAASIGDRP